MTTAKTVGVEAEYAKAKTSVWWDIENCEVPRNWDAHAIAQNVTSALSKMDYGGPVSISAYGDTNLIPHDVQQALSSTGVGLNHVPSGVKDASDKKILVDMCLWAADNPAPANFMLISGDRDFSYALHQLRMRRYNILLAQPPHASAPLVAAAKNVWLWTSLASGGPPLTSGEPPRPVNNGRCEVSKHQVSEQVQSSKPPGSTSDAIDTKERKPRENHVPGGLPQEMRRNIPQSGRAATGESVNAHLAEKKHIPQATFVASQKAQASVSAKPIEKADLVEPVLCQVCQISCSSKETYTKHTYGKRHRNNLELQSGKSENMSGGSTEPSKEDLEKQKKKKARDGKAKQKADYVCHLCNVTCQTQTVFDSHLRGQRHASKLNQSKLQEKGVGEKDQARETTADPKQNTDNAYVASNNQIVFDSHLRGQKNTAMLRQSEALIDSNMLQKKEQPKEKIAETQLQFQKAQKISKCREKHVVMVNQSQALVDSKMLHEKVVGEKDQPKQTIAVPQLQSQNTTENSKCSEKHVAGVNLSEVLVNSRKLEDKCVQGKPQPIETIRVPQSQLQNTQEQTKLFEKQNEEWGEKCGSSKIFAKEPFPSTKDRIETVNKQLPNEVFLFGDQRSVFEVPKEARECFDGNVKPVNLSKGATNHSGEVNKKKKEVMMASDDAKSSVSTKTIKEPEGLQPVWCQVCQISCYNKVAYANHMYGKKHRQKLELQSAKNENMSMGSAKLPKENAEKNKKLMCKNQTAFDSHLKSQNHAAVVKEQAEVKLLGKIDDLWFQGVQANNEELKERNAISESSKRVFTELKRESLPHKESGHPLDVISETESVKFPPDWILTKKSPNQTVFGSRLKSQNHAAIVKEQAKALVEARKTREESDQEKKQPREALEKAFIEKTRIIQKERDQEQETTNEHALEKMGKLGIRKAQDDNKEIKDGCATSETLVFIQPYRESTIRKESKGCLDVIPERVKLPPVVTVTEKLEEKSKHKPEPNREPENKSAGLKEHPMEATKKEEIKGQVDNLWTRLWGKKV